MGSPTTFKGTVNVAQGQAHLADLPRVACGRLDLLPGHPTSTTTTPPDGPCPRPPHYVDNRAHVPVAGGRRHAERVDAVDAAHRLQPTDLRRRSHERRSRDHRATTTLSPISYSANASDEEHSLQERSPGGHRPHLVPLGRQRLARAQGRNRGIRHQRERRALLHRNSRRRRLRRWGERLCLLRRSGMESRTSLPAWTKESNRRAAGSWQPAVDGLHPGRLASDARTSPSRPGCASTASATTSTDRRFDHPGALAAAPRSCVGHQRRRPQRHPGLGRSFHGPGNHESARTSPEFRQFTDYYWGSCSLRHRSSPGIRSLDLCPALAASHRTPVADGSRGLGSVRLVP